ncbi:hypothetical protein VOLCADRAFT_127352 [Volvox carteri f. nagariensis]|uniref:Uncharacterized protein n=1 Tax=Volvox carteri f. nagariensis TaxID=3068 RepID=D8THU0_VOLCA|nr:uncharacterized protein VOLCADRAFT_127352 [Volvox carteri f. nagariensis]EFJ52774.1 hypothetical protein VOLCADRAFT_127352 [Volvox carteri f. nagariensis]|eukprot:XP_002945779.1 hypothetical protein VOLCADRAFT_127352 [Volvox carteri f. nagariensis]
MGRGRESRFQVQGSAVESTCGAPIIVVLVRYRRDPESGLSRECQRAQFAPGATSFAVKGRNILCGPDVSPDGCIYATPLEKNGIAHLNNFCLMYPYNGQADASSTPASGSSSALDQQAAAQQSLSSSGSRGAGKLQATRRLRDMLAGQGATRASGGGGGGGGGGALGNGSEVMQDSSDALHSNGELCLLVQLLRRDARQPGRWFAYDMPHLISRPFKVGPFMVVCGSCIPPGCGCGCGCSSDGHQALRSLQPHRRTLL